MNSLILETDEGFETVPSAEFVSANPELAEDVAGLAPGESLEGGGGAAPWFKVTNPANPIPGRIERARNVARDQISAAVLDGDLGVASELLCDLIEDLTEIAALAKGDA